MAEPTEDAPKEKRLTKAEAAEVVKANALRGSIAAHQLDEHALMNLYGELNAKKEAKEKEAEMTTREAPAKEEEMAEPTQEEVAKRQTDLEQKILGLLDELTPKKEEAKTEESKAEPQPV